MLQAPFQHILKLRANKLTDQHEAVCPRGTRRFLSLSRTEIADIDHRQCSVKTCRRLCKVDKASTSMMTSNDAMHPHSPLVPSFTWRTWRTWHGPLPYCLLEAPSPQPIGACVEDNVDPPRCARTTKRTNIVVSASFTIPTRDLMEIQ